MKFQAIRGTHDILPEEAERFHEVESAARSVFERFGFGEIRTPTFETLALFHRSLGATTDVVEKEMYAFEDRGGRKLALRPEGTAGVVRAFIEHHLDQIRPFCKLFYIGSMFRAERPQAGRYREFGQIGAESFGNASPVADAELLLLIQTLFDTLHIKDFQLKVNSLGDEKCRPLYRRALTEFLEKEKSHLCEDCRRRMVKNPLRVLDCKIDGPRLTHLPTVNEYWCTDCRTHFETVQSLFEKAGGRAVFTPRLVRGLDYYTRTVFEVTTRVLGAQDALAAGGRYDTLVKDVGGPVMPALGFALGLERTVEAAKASGGETAVRRKPLIFIAAQSVSVIPQAFELLESLRLSRNLHDVRVEGGFFEKKLGAQLALADRLEASFCIILGEEELQKNEVTLRSLKTSTQERIPRSQLVPHLAARVAHA